VGAESRGRVGAVEGGGGPGCGGTLRRFDTMPHDCRGCPATERGMLHAEKRG